MIERQQFLIADRVQVQRNHNGLRPGTIRLRNRDVLWQFPLAQFRLGRFAQQYIVKFDGDAIGRLLSMLRKGDATLEVQDDASMVRIRCDSDVVNNGRSRRRFC